ncbi:uncharacterized protein EV154DRAFT_482181 [Mucor mucedo]|uniref:uncharacterized protein n=1 Tax=Mucor mucedo TaxID=29922 RepID=UPI00222050BE|nr:uncharacterized protein EV154DRAFT_482181 [Mucor mucedo]KAI7890456.1 hypothetical protein EV154DRAFT_482181 [Mucor mucedo]
MAKHLANVKKILGNSGITTPVGKCTIIDGWLPTTGKWNEGGIFKGSDSNFYFHNVDPRLSQIDAMNQGIIGFRSGFLLFNWMDTRTRAYLPRFEWINTPKQPLNVSFANIRFTGSHYTKKIYSSSKFESVLRTYRVLTLKSAFEPRATNLRKGFYQNVAMEQKIFKENLKLIIRF